MKRLGDQVLILDAIRNVRSELKKDMSFKDASEVMLRLVTLYSLLNVEQLKDVAEQADVRDERKAA